METARAMPTTAEPSRPMRAQSVRLANGSRLRIRPLRPDDAVAYERFVRGLSDETLHNRLLGAGLAITPEALDYMVTVDQRTHVALAAVERTSEGERIVGVARYALEVDPDVAEIAMTVTDAWQGKGLGRALLGALVRRARADGVKALFGDMFPGNAAMVGLLRNAGFALTASPGDAHLTRGTRLLAPPRRRAPRTAPPRAPSRRTRPG